MAAISPTCGTPDPFRPLTAAMAESVVAGLALDGIFVAVHPGRVVGIDALVPCTTLQEVQAITAVRAVTDSRLVWHGKDGGR